MGRTAVGVIYALVMIAVIVTVDLLFMRDQPWARLAVNVGIAAVFAGGYFAFMRR